MVWSTVAHVAVGALVLATTVVLAIQSQRYAPKGQTAASPISVPDGAPHVDKAVTA